jgi:hypothetical protein
MIVSFFQRTLFYAFPQHSLAVSRLDASSLQRRALMIAVF